MVSALGGLLVVGCRPAEDTATDDTSAADTDTAVDTCPEGQVHTGSRLALPDVTERVLYSDLDNLNIGWSLDAWQDRILVGGAAESGGGPAPPNLGNGQAFVTTVPEQQTDIEAHALFVVRSRDMISQLGFSSAFTSDGRDVFLGEHHNFTTPEVYGGKAMLYDIGWPNPYQDPLLEIVADREDDIYSAFGWDVAVGTVTGGDHDDLIVAAPAASPYGAVLIYTGDPTGYLSMQDWDAQVRGVTWGTEELRPVLDNLAVHGDLDADGVNDLVVGAPATALEGNDWLGAVHVMCSPVVGDLSTDDACLSLIGGEVNEYVGTSVDTLGDFDCDGYDDLVVGAQWAQANGPGSGRVYVVSGSHRGSHAIAALAAATFDGPTPYQDVGFEVAGRFDFDGDGALDLAAGAPGDFRQPTETGRVYVFRGPFQGRLEAANALELVGAEPGDRAGNAIVAMADQDADGRDELVIGAPYDSEWTNKGGKVYVVFGFWPE